LFGKLIPRKDVFFEYMEALTAKAAEILVAFRAQLDHPAEAQARLAAVKAVEHEADRILHRTLGELQTSFITPLDRNEISTISRRLDDIVDLVEGAAMRMYYYDIREVRPPLLALLDVLERQVKALSEAMGMLHDRRKPEPLRECIVRVHTLENDADDILRPAIGGLFRDEQDPRLILKWKEVYEHVEKATDRCEDVADHIENILLEYA
jgi:predicted phosphate transport protein (TIGR00153 family)